jgi:hypothetical protein
LTCGGCGGFHVDVVAGEELRVEWVEIEESVAPGTGEEGYDDG